MRLTVLGSCRQDSLYKLYPCTSIRNELTYPHYTKEVLQAIEFCKGVSTIRPELSQYLFRSGILEQKALYSKTFQQDFEETDLFVIEIASRISYKYANHYTHHILTEPLYGFCNRDEIVQRDLTDHEIEQDLLRIVELIRPKKLMIVSHIYTRTTGKRYELVKLLSKLCATHSIPFFDPIVQLGSFDPHRLFVKEDTLAHYTEEGHHEIGKKYNEFINRL